MVQQQPCDRRDDEQLSPHVTSKGRSHPKDHRGKHHGIHVYDASRHQHDEDAGSLSGGTVISRRTQSSRFR